MRARASPAGTRMPHRVPEPVFCFYFFFLFFTFWLILVLTGFRSRDPRVGCNNPPIITYLAICCCNGVAQIESPRSEANRITTITVYYLFSVLSPFLALTLLSKLFFLKLLLFYIAFVGDCSLSEQRSRLALKPGCWYFLGGLYR